MSDFFEWLSQYAPLGALLIIWLVTAPIRLAVMLVLPYGAKHAHHFFNPVYEFFAFEDRL